MDWFGILVDIPIIFIYFIAAKLSCHGLFVHLFAEKNKLADYELGSGEKLLQYIVSLGLVAYVEHLIVPFSMDMRIEFFQGAIFVGGIFFVVAVLCSELGNRNEKLWPYLMILELVYWFVAPAVVCFIVKNRFA